MNIIENLKGNIVVSCQALEGEPLHVPGYMTKMALAASKGGAVAVRANGPEDIASIKTELGIPVIGIWKITSPDSDVFITPTIEAAREVYEAGADIIGVDATFRKNCDGEWAWEIIKQIKGEMDVLVMADISTLEEGINAAEEGADIVGTTLSGYTNHTGNMIKPDFNLIRELSSKIDVPVMAEGRISTIEQVKTAFDLGAYSVTIGGSITRPMQITESYVKGIREYHREREDKGLAFIDQYYRNIVFQMEQILLEQKYKIISIAKKVAERIEAGGTIYLYGTECHPILKSDSISYNIVELNNQGEKIIETDEQILQKYDLKEKDTILIISNSEINTIAVDLVKEAKKRGVYIINLLNLSHNNSISQDIERKLYELSDENLNSNAINSKLPISMKRELSIEAMSTAINMNVLQILMIEIEHYLTE